MKYNKSEIMKRAWELKKANKNNIFRLCLKMAWAEAKTKPEDINYIFPEISLSGKTGTEKQRVYAESLLKAARQTAILNGVAGYHDTDKPGIQQYIPQDDADSFVGAYRLLKNGVGIRKTYGEVIDLIKDQYTMIRLAENIKNEARKAGKSIEKFVDDMFVRK